MQEDIKKIAESLGFGYLEGEIFKRHIKSKTTYGHRLFNPYENSADAFMVLKALLKKGRSEGWHITIFDDGIDMSWCGYLKSWKDSENLNNCICTAYLSLIGDKDNG